MIILGLSGKARAGKSRLSRELFKAAEKQGWEVLVKPFAGPLKHYVSTKLGFTKEDNPLLYRENCQKIGAKKRLEKADHWVDLWYDSILESRLEELSNSTNPVLYLVDDVRYINEMKILKNPKVNATLVFVKHGDRPIEDATGAWREHESEKLANLFETTSNETLKKEYKFDFVIHNDKEESVLEQWANSFLTFLSTNDPCLCESCSSNFEMRAPDIDKIDAELKEFLDDVLEEGDDDCT
jgi:guanylate kinase